MKFLISILATMTFVTLNAHADLVRDMKQLAVLKTALFADAKDLTSNAADLEAKATQMIALFQDALTQIPDTVSSEPADQQAASLAQYKTFIQDEINDLQKLVTAAQNKDAASVQMILADINLIEKTGHNQFNPPQN